MKPDVDRLTILTNLLDDTRMGARDLITPAREVPPYLRTPDGDGSPLVALPEEAPAVQDLETALRRRTSVRTYSGAPVQLSELATMVGAAHVADRRSWRMDADAGVTLEIFVAAWRVGGLAPALYRHEAGEGGLHRVAALPSGAEAEELVIQREFARAPLLLIYTGNLAAAVARAGSHGHRLLLVRAGAAAYASWLAALGMGLAGSLFAGMLPDALRRLAGADGYLRTSLFAFAVGRPPAI